MLSGEGSVAAFVQHLAHSAVGARTELNGGPVDRDIIVPLAGEGRVVFGEGDVEPGRGGDVDDRLVEGERRAVVPVNLVSLREVIMQAWVWVSA